MARRGPRVALVVGLAACAGPALAAGNAAVPLGGSGEASYLRLLLLFASVSLAPALLAVLTSFVRIIVVLFFLRAGLGNTQLLPNPVLIGFALLLTVCTMRPTLSELNRRAVGPLLAGRLTLAQAARAATPPATAYLQARVRADDLALLQALGRPTTAGAKADLANLAAAYVLGELRAAFLMGFVIYLPFLVIDLVVAGTLASVGLTALPQAAVALPFKVLLFVMVDGWRLLTETLLTSLR